MIADKVNLKRLKWILVFAWGKLFEALKTHGYVWEGQSKVGHKRWWKTSFDEDWSYREIKSDICSGNRIVETVEFIHTW